MLQSKLPGLGGAGKGFTVVASEVKELAAQTAGATEEISSLISNMQNSTTQAVNKIAGMNDGIEHINNITIKVARSLKNQRQSAHVISQHMKDGTKQIKALVGEVGSVGKARHENAHLTQEIAHTGQELGRVSSNLREEVDAFMKGVPSGRPKVGHRPISGIFLQFPNKSAGRPSIRATPNKN